MLIPLGVTLQAVSIYCLKAAKVQRLSRALYAGGAAALTGSALLFIAGLGAELGIAWALTTISIVAYSIVLLPLLRAKKIGHDRAQLRERSATAKPPGERYRFTARLLSAGPLYLMCSLALSLLIATLPWSPNEETRLFTGGLLCPVFWAAGALHATTDPNLWRILYLPIGLIVVAGIVVVAQ